MGVELAVEAREALRALAGLRWRRRRVLALRAAGYSYKEIAAKLGVTYTNVNRQLTEGRAELRPLRDAA
ncbi:MAG TPA: sigma factor-like helix-turn-helix DNA-binding protein [Thermoleophilaceae bacterium]|nr:sigma factor-like helix-turn-helix DNA-binding protein [Thermoleophilaceae bacterium]